MTGIAYGEKTNEGQIKRVGGWVEREPSRVERNNRTDARRGSVTYALRDAKRRKRHEIIKKEKVSSSWGETGLRETDRKGRQATEEKKDGLGKNGIDRFDKLGARSDAGARVEKPVADRKEERRRNLRTWGAKGEAIGP